MRPPRYRWLLPIGHLLIDGLILLMWIWHSTVILHNQKSSSVSPPVVTAGLSLQDDSGAAWDPQHIDYAPPGEVLFLSLGNLPAGIIASIAMPEAHVQTRRKLWDPIWFLILEATSFPFWFVIGAWLESGRLRIK